MVRELSRPGIGVVGAKLYYPDDTVQHVGVTIGIGGVAGHFEKRLPREADGRSEEHTSALQSLMRNSYAVVCLKTKSQRRARNAAVHHTRNNKNEEKETKT